MLHSGNDFVKQVLNFHFKLDEIVPRYGSTIKQSHIVYKFSCVNCIATYNGKTERHLNVRSIEHIRISHLAGKRVECKSSPVSDYLLLHSHGSNFNDPTILSRDNNVFKLLLRDSILISRDSPVLNNSTASIPLLLFD